MLDYDTGLKSTAKYSMKCDADIRASARVSFMTAAKRAIGRDVQAKLGYSSLGCDTEL